MTTRAERERLMVRMALVALVTSIMALLLTCSLVACAAPMDSNTHFARPKYDLGTSSKPTPGKPSVRQTWWKSLWFWQPQTTKYKPEQRP
jgi:hypothetical protein